MLKLTTPSRELYDEKNEEFITLKGQTIQLEHSLISISKWESKWNKAFLGKQKKTSEESLDYIRCMIITPNVDENIIHTMDQECVDKVEAYISAPMTATVIGGQKKGANKDVITSEVIYYWMVAHNIPFECQKWHLNRLLTLVSVCNAKNSPPSKMSKKDLIERNRSLNEARKRQFNHKG